MRSRPVRTALVAGGVTLATVGAPLVGAPLVGAPLVAGATGVVGRRRLSVRRHRMGTITAV